MHSNIKRLLSLIFIFSSLSLVYTQESNQPKSNTIEYKEMSLNDNDIVYMPVYHNTNVNFITQYVAIEPKKDEGLNVFDAKWNTKIFNPYLGENIIFPFLIKFTNKNFSSPIDRKMVVTSRFGWRRRRPHRGIDIDLQIGDSVRSILDGKVRYSKYHGGHGNTVIVRHSNGLETVYAHLSKNLVKENDEVKKGQVIGTGGITGNSRGSHLHLEVRYQGKSINPEYLFEFTNKNEIRSEVFYVTKKWTNPRYHISTRKSKIVVCDSIDDIALQSKQEKEIYTVRKGDTLHRIANKYGVAVSEICKINSIPYNSVLKIGQQILVN